MYENAMLDVQTNYCMEKSTLKSPKLSLFYCVNIFVRMCTAYSLHLILQKLHKEYSTPSKHGGVFCEERSFTF